MKKDVGVGDQGEIIAEFSCPFCPGKAGLVEVGDAKVMGTFHTEPMCERFLSLPADRYLHAANQRVQN